MPEKGEELIGRAAKRTDWAGTALESAGDDLAEASDHGGSLDGLKDRVQQEAEVVSHLAEDIESRKDDNDVFAAAGRGGRSPKGAPA